jgi:hypothetical protein
MSMDKPLHQCIQPRRCSLPSASTRRTPTRLARKQQRRGQGTHAWAWVGRLRWMCAERRKEGEGHIPKATAEATTATLVSPAMGVMRCGEQRRRSKQAFAGDAWFHPLACGHTTRAHLCGSQPSCTPTKRDEEHAGLADMPQERLVGDCMWAAMACHHCQPQL